MLMAISIAALSALPILLVVFFYRDFFGEVDATLPKFLSKNGKGSKSFSILVAKFRLMRLFDVHLARVYSNESSNILYFKVSSSRMPIYCHCIFLRKSFDNDFFYKSDNPELNKMMHDHYSNKSSVINNEKLKRIYEITGRNRFLSRIWLEKNEHGIVFVLVRTIKNYDCIKVLADEYGIDVD